MTFSPMEGVVELMNCFPSKKGISDDISPAMMLEGKPKLDMNMKILELSAYAFIFVMTANNI